MLIKSVNREFTTIAVRAKPTLGIPATSNFFQLPFDALNEINSYLTPKEIRSLMCLSRKYLHVIMENGFFHGGYREFILKAEKEFAFEKKELCLSTFPRLYSCLIKTVDVVSLRHYLSSTRGIAFNRLQAGLAIGGACLTFTLILTFLIIADVHKYGKCKTSYSDYCKDYEPTIYLHIIVSLFCGLLGGHLAAVPARLIYPDTLEQDLVEIHSRQRLLRQEQYLKYAKDFVHWYEEKTVEWDSKMSFSNLS